MVRDLSDKTQVQRQLASRTRRAQAATRQQDMAVDRGAFRVKSEEGLEVGTAEDPTGSQVVYGILKIIGDLIGEGDINWEGVANLRGPVHITGENGSLTVDAETLLQGVTRMLADLRVENDGKITAGNVRIEDGKIYIGTMVLDPENHDGMITMPNDGQVLGFEDNLELYSPAGPDGRNGVIIGPDHVAIAKLPVATSTTGLRWVGADILGNLWAVPPNIGGPTGGPLQWPFPSNTVSSEYGPRESPGPGGSTFHEGLDFDPGEGAPIPAAGAGIVELAGLNGGFGNCVIINHGDGLKTLYGHMQTTPSVTVGQTVTAGQILGLVGNTGVSFGAHLHFEVHVNGSPVNPRTKLPQN